MAQVWMISIPWEGCDDVAFATKQAAELYAAKWHTNYTIVAVTVQTTRKVKANIAIHDAYEAQVDSDYLQ